MMPEWAHIIWRTLAAVVILFFMTKVLGKRQISELSLFEYITGITIGNIAAYISLDLEELWFLGIISLVVWVSVSVAIEYWTLKNKKVRDYVDGKGTALIKDGKLLKQEMRKERLTLDELLEQLRQKNVYRMSDVEFAVMESSGELNVLLKKQFQPLTPDMLGWKMNVEKPAFSVIMDGQIVRDELGLSGKDEAFLEREMKRYGLKVEDVYLAQIDSSGEIVFQTIDGRSLPEEKPDKPADRIRDMARQLELELTRLEQMALNESDRKQYKSALYHLKKGLEAASDGQGGN